MLRCRVGFRPVASPAAGQDPHRGEAEDLAARRRKCDFLLLTNGSLPKRAAKSRVRG